MVVFGCVSIGQGFVKSYSGLLVARFFLGLAEASVFFGCFYLIAMYVPRLLCQKFNNPEPLEQVVQTRRGPEALHFSFLFYESCWGLRWSFGLRYLQIRWQGGIG